MKGFMLFINQFPRKWVLQYLLWQSFPELALYPSVQSFVYINSQGASVHQSGYKLLEERLARKILPTA